MRKREPAAEGRNGKRKIRLLTAVLLAAVMVVAMVQLSGADVLNIEVNDCSLTVNACGENSEYYEDLQNANVQVQVYQVATAVDTGGKGYYGYNLNSPFGENEKMKSALSAEALPDITNEIWRELATEAANIVKSGTVAQVAGSPVAAGTELTGLQTGLYLLMVPDNTVITEKYIYTFNPELISIPSKEPDEDGNIKTSNPGDWIYDMNVNLKPERKDRFGSLEIVKTLTAEEGAVMKDPATFVFRVVATLDGEEVYNRVVSMTFTDTGEQRLRIDDIPVGATVTVTEEYTGGCVVIGPDELGGTISLEDVLELHFYNEYRYRDGFGVENHFEYSESNGWQWEQERP